MCQRSNICIKGELDFIIDQDKSGVYSYTSADTERSICQRKVSLPSNTEDKAGQKFKLDLVRQVDKKVAVYVI